MREYKGPNRRSILLAGFSAAAGSWKVLAAKDTEFWNHKEPSEWTTDEIDRLITRSPWAKEVSATTTPSGQPGGSYPGGQGRSGISLPGMGGGGIPGMGGGHGGHGGGHGGGQHSAPQVKLFVRWESATPVLEALRQRLPEAFAGHYVIGVSGVPASETRNQSDDEDAADRAKGLTYLEANNKSLQPGLAQQSPSANTNSFLFGFSKDLLTLSADDGEVHFTTQIGHMQIKAKFSLSEMVYRGKLAV